MAKKEKPKGSGKPEKMDPAVQDILRRKQLEAMVAARTMTDEAFRKEFLADPKGTLKKALGIDLGKINMVVHEETASTVHVSVPPFQKADGELSDELLESVAGGRGTTGGWGGTPTGSFTIPQCQDSSGKSSGPIQVVPGVLVSLVWA